MSLEDSKIKKEDSTATVATSVEEPKKAERRWWRKLDPEQENNLPKNFDTPPSPPTPTSPLSSTIETKRFEFVRPSSFKLLTLNDVFTTAPSISWKKRAKKTKEDFDFYQDTINVSWDQTIESKRQKPVFPHLQKEEQAHSRNSSKVAMEFIGKQQREVPTVAGEEKRGSGANFIPRKDAQEFRPSRPQVQDDYFSRTGELLDMLQSSNKRDAYMLGKREMNPSRHYDSYSSKRTVKPDSHNLSSYSENDYSDYVDRAKYYPSSRSMASHERSHHEEPHHYAHAGYAEARPYRDEHYGRGEHHTSRDHYRHYDRESIARDYYDKERLYHQMHRDRRHMYDMQTEADILRRYERRRQDPESYRYRDRGPYSASDRISTYDEYERVVTQRQQRRQQLHERERRHRARAAEPQYPVEQDPRWREYYRMKYDELRRRQNAY